MKNTYMNKSISGFKQTKTSSSSSTIRYKNNDSSYQMKKNYSGVTFKNVASKSSLLNIKSCDKLIENLSKEKLEIIEKEEEMKREWEENEIKLKETLHSFNNIVRKSEGSGVNTLIKIRGIMLNWLKESDQDNLEYSKFMTEKKMKYLIRNKEKTENKIKQLEIDINNIKTRKLELEKTLGDIYLSYETEELEKEIDQFANSKEIKNGKSIKMIQKFEEMKKMLNYVKEYNIIKNQDMVKKRECEELIKFSKSSIQTFEILTNYYKNLKNRINDLAVNIK